MADPQPHLVDRLQTFGTTVFAEINAIAGQYNAVNLGQGAPDADGPIEVADAAVAALRHGHNQYPPINGVAELRHAVAEHQQRFYGIELDPDTEVMATAGATEAIAATILALCEAGDEVVTFEPYYDSYAATMAMAGAKRIAVALRPPLDPDGAYWFDEAQLRAAVTPATKLLILNSPHNPTGKVFTAAELRLIADLCIENDVIAMTDEVYEHLLFDGHQHLPLCTLDGMAERTITISSGGKTFSYTGWKIGWVTGPADLVNAVRTVKQFLTFVNGGPFQYGIATGLRLGDGYFEGFQLEFLAKRDQLLAGLRAAGIPAFKPEGTYFITADIATVSPGLSGIDFCKTLPERCGVAAIPAQGFYDDQALGETMVRFAFCKQPHVLDEAVVRLAALTM